MNIYNVLIIGAGRIAALYDEPKSIDILSYAHALSEDSSFNIIGFYDIDYKKAKYAAKRWNCEAFLELKQAMKQVDIVCCCVPDEYHAEILEEVIQYPVRLVIAEKPLVKTFEDAKKIQALYNNKMPLLINYSRRFLDEFIDLKKKIRCFGKFLKGNGYYGKGVLHNGSHMIDILKFLLGSIENVEDVLHPINDFRKDDLSCDVIFKIESGYFYMSTIDSRIATIFEIDLLFEKARIRILDGGTRIEKYDLIESSFYEGQFNYLLTESVTVNYSQAMRGLLKNAKRYLESGEELYCTLNDGINVLGNCIEIQGYIT